MKITKMIGRLVRGSLMLPCTLYVNFRALPLKQAVKMPIIAMSWIKCQGIKRGNIVIEGPVKSGMVQIGALKTGRRGVYAYPRSSISVDNDGKIIFRGKATFGKGTAICANGGIIDFGKNFSCNVNCFVYSQKRIVFKEDVLMGWNINIRDNDGHPIFNNVGEEINQPKPIVFGNHVWIGSHADVLKNVELADGIVVATRSVVTKSCSQERCILGGVPAKIIKKDVVWHHDANSDT